MTEFEREERAFRSALAQHASDAPEVPAVGMPSQRARGFAIVAAAAVAAIVLGAFIAVPAITGGDERVGPSPAGRTPTVDESQWQWIGLHAVEVAAPIGWGFAHEGVRPDCVDLDNPHDLWGKGVPTAPYVTVTPTQRASPLIGCTAQRPGNPDPAFGDLPFPLWQPHVRLEVARPDLQQPDREDGAWAHDGWRLTRRTIDDVQVSVLTAPNGPDIAEQVFASARTVTTNNVGCETSSPFSDGFPQPDGAPVPSSADVQSIAVCDYSRIAGYEGLQGSWLMTGLQARDLTAAILAANRGGGPDKPQNCLPDMHGDSAVALRFFGADNSPLAEAYVYTQWCFGNGIVDSSGPRTLTFANCSAVFSRPEVTWWGGQADVMRLCRP